MAALVEARLHWALGLADVIDDAADRNAHPNSSVGIGLRWGLTDLRRLPLLASSAWLISLIAALAVMTSVLLDQLVDAGEAYVALNSRPVVFLDPDLDVSGRDVVVTEIARVDGVSKVEPSVAADLEALPLTMAYRPPTGHAYTVFPNGDITIDAMEIELSQMPGVVAQALTISDRSLLAIRLAGQMVPWMAAGMSVLGILMLAVLALIGGRTRRDEVEAMNAIGSGRFDAWLASAVVVMLPALLAVTVAGATVVLATPWVASMLLPSAAAKQITEYPLVRTAVLLVIGTVLVTAFLTYVAARPRRTR